MGYEPISKQARAWLRDTPYPTRNGKLTAHAAMVCASIDAVETCAKSCGSSTRHLAGRLIGELKDVYRRDGQKTLHCEETPAERKLSITLTDDDPVTIQRIAAIGHLLCCSDVTWTPAAEAMLREALDLLPQFAEEALGLQIRVTITPIIGHPARRSRNARP